MMEFNNMQTFNDNAEKFYRYTKSTDTSLLFPSTYTCRCVCMHTHRPPPQHTHTSRDIEILGT